MEMSSRTMLDSEKLLQLVKQNSCLYDTDHPQYLSAVSKRRVWVSIGKELGLPGPVCKSRWNNMRDTYRKSLFKKTKGVKRNRSKEPYGNEMEFLKKFFKPKLSFLEEVHAEESGQMSSEEWDDKEKGSDCLDESSADDRVPTYGLCKTEEVDVEYMENVEERLGQADEENSAITEYAHLYDLKEKGKPVNPFASLEHPVDAFLAGIAPTLKSLSPYHLGLAKMEIFQAIHKYEMKSIAPRSGNSKTKTKEQPSSSQLDDDNSD